MTTQKPTIAVSLILTTRNEARNAALFFDGVRAGSVLPEEIVICDGGSSDGTVEAFREAAGDLPVVFIEEADANIAAGRNRALERATHDIVAITDAGCMIDPEWLKRITEPLLLSADVDAVGGGYTLIGDSPIQRWTAASTLPLERHDPDAFLPSSRSFAARRTAILDAGGYPEELTFAGEDTALVLEMKRCGARFVTRWDALVHWYPRPTFRALCRQYYLYGLGDGEARSLAGSYLRRAVKTVGFVLLLVLGFINPWLFLLPAVALVAYCAWLAPQYDWKQRSLSEALGGFLLLTVKDIAMLSGYLRGRLGAKKGVR